MVWRTCAPFWLRSARGCVRALGQMDVVTDLNFYASALDPLAARVGGLTVHVAKQRSSVRVSVKVTKTSSTVELPPSLPSQSKFRAQFGVISQLVFGNHHVTTRRPGLDVQLQLSPIQKKFSRQLMFNLAGSVIQYLLNLARCLMPFSATNPTSPSSSYCTVYRNLLVQGPV